MKKLYAVLIGALFLSLTSVAQDTIYRNNFSGGSAGWTLEENDVIDAWTVNNSYNCSPATPNAGGGNYLHVMSDFLVGDCAVAYYGTGAAGTIYATMTTDINTTGYSSVNLSFSWLCQGQVSTFPTYGSVWYSTNGGGSWTRFTNPRTNYNGQSSWTSTTITSTNYPALLNQTTLRLRFGWTNSAIGSNPAFAVDNILLTGTGSACSNVGGTAAANPTSVCTGQTSSISLTGSSGTIQWQESANGTSGWTNVSGGSGATTTSYTTAALSTTTYYRAVLSEASCPDQNSNTITVTVTPPVTPTLTIAVSPNDTLCQGVGANFSINTSSNEGSSPSYQWKVNTANTGTGATFSLASPNDGDSVHLEMTSNAACAAPTTVSSNSIKLHVTPSVTPSVMIYGDPMDTVCTGIHVYLRTAITNGGSSPVYVWKKNGNTVTGSDNWISLSVNDGDIMTCELTSNAECANPTTVESNKDTVTVLPLPAVPTITQSGDTLISSPAYGYQWWTGNYPIQGEIYRELVLTTSGEYEVVVNDENGCEASSALFNAILTSITNETLTGVRVYPNPVNQLLTIELNQKNSTIVSITDAVGRVVMPERLIAESKTFDLSSLPSGIYNLRIQQDSQAQITRLVKIR